jgi:hypothetical protein
MGQSSIRLLTLAVCAMLAGGSMVTPAQSGTSHNKHIKKHGTMRLKRGFSEYRPSDRAWRAAGRPSVAGSVCPGGIARSFECSRWPPPIDEDPDRVISGSSGD